MSAHTVRVTESAIEFSAPADQSVLHAMARLGKKGIPKGCLGGGCGVCKIRVISGSYRTGKMSRDQVTEDEQRAGLTLACKTFAESDLTLEVVGKMQRAVNR